MKNLSFLFPEPVWIEASASIVGTKEGEGPYGTCFDVIGGDNTFGCETWEEAESVLQKEALQLAMNKAKITKEEVQAIFAGDLLGQSIASSFGLASFDLPHIGLYGACSTSGLSLAIGSIAILSGMAGRVACVTSSHFASAEKEFRAPLAYGSQRPLSASWTVTGGGALLLTNEKKDTNLAKISGITLGKIVDYGLKDSMNMGACMAPAAADTIARHLQEFQRVPSDYDRIVTGDLGSVGRKHLYDLLEEKQIDIATCHMDCGIEIFDAEKQDTHAGGSGCACAAVILSAYLLDQLKDKKWKRILFVPTGALLSKLSFNEGKTVPGIAHAVVIEQP